jgi:hypothetical protein
MEIPKPGHPINSFLWGNWSRSGAEAETGEEKTCGLGHVLGKDSNSGSKEPLRFSRKGFDRS